MQEEIWKDIPNYEGLYQVSNLGRVKSLPRIKMNCGKYPFMTKERILKVSKNNKGYFYAKLSLNSVENTIAVHKLVAISFLNHTHCGYKEVVDHINNNREDNRLENLQLITPRENSSKDRMGYSSRYIGVSKHKANDKWEAKIHIKGKNIYLGRFTTEQEAYLAYQNKLKEISK
jgi:hypothetical protein